MGGYWLGCNPPPPSPIHVWFLPLPPFPLGTTPPPIPPLDSTPTFCIAPPPPPPLFVSGYKRTAPPPTFHMRSDLKPPLFNNPVSTPAGDNIRYFVHVTPEHAKSSSPQCFAVHAFSQIMNIFSEPEEYEA